MNKRWIVAAVVVVLIGGLAYWRLAGRHRNDSATPAANGSQRSAAAARAGQPQGNKRGLVFARQIELA